MVKDGGGEGEDDETLKDIFMHCDGSLILLDVRLEIGNVEKIFEEN